jgi:predicted Zn finger-like uncharacterized protein
MRIICPSCKAAYEVPDAVLGAAARRLRCARCAHEWSPELPEAAAPALPPPPPAPREERRPAPVPRPEPVRPLPVPRADAEPPPSLRARPGRFPGLESIATVAASLVLLAALCWAAYAWRAEVMQVWPPSQRLFAALGLR